MSDSNADVDEWRLYASCLGLDWVMFFPNRGESTKQAKAICDTCLVKVQCLDDAVRRKEPAGVRGGMSTKARRTIIAKRRND
jgi:WhiB family redox-sensing transcriptional regulator